MKVCPQCHAGFDNDINFCLYDGTQLPGSRQSDVPTANYPAPIVEVHPAQPQPTIEYLPATGEVSEEPTAPPKPIEKGIAQRENNGSWTTIFIFLAAGFAVIVTVILGVVGVLYITVYREPEVATANSSPISINNVNTANASSNLSDTNSTASASNTNLSLPSNSLSEPTSNTKIAANGKPAPTPLRNSNSMSTSDVKELPRQEVLANQASDTMRPKTISGGTLNGRAISLPKPVYPPAARAVRASGRVDVQVLIDETGRVISANAISGNALLAPAALSAARSARFSPTLLSGQPVKVSGVISYNFVP